ncbi:MAG: ferrous iron transport protein B [Clostridia bacterium]|nr:ferrous iron transport protein B [Clostridia bacterium]
MGLTKHSVGLGATTVPDLRAAQSETAVIALAGNPNVGKSTVFNALTGMHQHTGNWPGKTVACAQGRCTSDRHTFTLVDIPGTYSLSAHSAEEKIARDFLFFGEPDATVAVCDATCLLRNLHLVLQILECGARVVVCVNLLDEARKKQIELDLDLLQERLGVPVVGVTARKKRTLSPLLGALDDCMETPLGSHGFCIPYPHAIETAIGIVENALDGHSLGRLDSRWVALRLLDGNEGLQKALSEYLGSDLSADEKIRQALREARLFLSDNAIDAVALGDLIVSSTVSYAEHLMRGVIKPPKKDPAARDRKLDRILTGRLTGYPVMILLLLFIFWLTIRASNVPSELLSSLFFGALDHFSVFLCNLGLPPWSVSFLCDGVLRVLAWVVSVMLPPMAIFFPLFTLLEDSGYLPRVAYNLDRPFQRCDACGKQALSMCMGFGCNAAGVVGCRIIDSPRERLLAILTNSLVPCNGRFPALVTLITLFLIGGASQISSFWSALVLTLLIVLSVAVTLCLTRLLSKTVLKGVPSSFTLEMPPFRRPQFGQVLIRSIFDRTLFVLARSIAVAAPAGAVIWILANVSVGDATLLSHASDFLDPFARLIGMDGVILLAFILGFPANEIVIPIIVMAYRAQGTLSDYGSLGELGALLQANGWTLTTALCVLVFFLFHWPCSTTLLTVKKETGSLKWTLLAAALPTVLGMLLCFLISSVSKVLGL